MKFTAIFNRITVIIVIVMLGIVAKVAILPFWSLPYFAGVECVEILIPICIGILIYFIWEKIYPVSSQIARTPQGKANALIEQANAWHKNKHYEKAIAAYREAMEIFPTYRMYEIVVGDMLSKLNKSKEAIDSYRKVLRANPDDGETWYMLGINLMVAEKVNEAAECFENSIRLAKEPKAFFACAQAYERLGDLQKAKEYLAIAISLDPEMKSSAREDYNLKNLL